MRVEYDLGESTLGEVDPSSATMNLVLLGLRGIAANVLWMEHEELNKTKNWARVEATVHSIITLQPHFLQVWRYHGWNLAFNVSSQWDDVRDRFFWVKKGTKFTMEGVNKNVNYAELPWDVGRMVGHKIGRSDEWRFFRKYFLKDPDPEASWDGKKADPAINPQGEDNYLVAYEWYTAANKTEAKAYKASGDKKGQHQMMRELFRHYPARSYFDWADALHREGTFGDVSATAWNKAYEEWAYKYGKERFKVEGQNIGYYWLNPEKDDVEIMLKYDEELENVDVSAETKKKWIVMEQNVTNYRYWLSRGQIEKNKEMVDAHREMYEGRQLFKSGKTDWHEDGTPPESVQKLASGLKKFEKMFAKFEALKTEAADDLAQDDTLIEEAMLAIKYYRQAYKNSGGYPLPDNYPMKKLWDSNQARVESIDREFTRDLGGRRNQ